MKKCVVSKLFAPVDADLEKRGEMTFIISRPDGQAGDSDYVDGYYTNISINGYIDSIRTNNDVINKINGQTVSPTNIYVNTGNLIYNNTVAMPAALSGEKVRVAKYSEIIQLTLSENITTDSLAKLQNSSINAFNKRGNKNAPKISVEDFNKISTIKVFNGADIIGDTSDFQANTNLSELKATLDNLKGNISNIIQCFPNLTMLSLGIGVTGTFDEFGALAGITELQAYLIPGSLEDFVTTARKPVAQGGGGRTTGSVTLHWCNEVTWKGEKNPSNSSATLSWDATTITYKGETITA